MPKMPDDLPENDRALAEAAVAGREWMPAKGKASPTPDDLANEGFVATMPVIRANTIRALYLGLWDGVAVDPTGVRMRGARIDGTLDLSFGMGRGALSLQHCHFDEQVVIRNGRLPALWLSGSYLAKGLSGDGARVDGDLFCRDGFHSIGEVRLLGAQIGGTADFEGATLDGNDGAALNADGIVVTGSLFGRKGEDKGFHIKGAAILVGARIGGLMDWRPGQWTGELDLSHAVVGQWRDDWGASAKTEAGQSSIKLDHFTYGAFFSGNGMKADSTTRIAWIQAAQGENFTPGPYRTLARVLRAAGDDRGAAAVGLAKEQARSRHRIATYRKQPGLWGPFFWWVPAGWLWFWTSLFNLFVGHGYRPWRGVGWLVGFLALGCLLFCWGAPTSYGGPGLIKPADPVFVTENQTRNLGRPDPTTHAIEYKLPPEYTPFNAFWYSFDTLIPLIDLGQEKAWSPSPLTPEIARDPAGWALLFYLYLHIIMGWVLTTLTVVALTGLIKRDKEEE